MIKVALVFDYDLTLTNEFQQMPLIRKYMDNYKKIYNTPEMIERFRKINSSYNGFNNPEDFFEIIQMKRKELLIKCPSARFQNGITWISQLWQDMQKGGPLENCTDKELFELGKEVKMARGVLECFSKLKSQWAEKNVQVNIYIVSVGLKTLIEGAIGKYVDGIYAGEIVDGQIISVVEDFSKTEIAFELAKGSKEKRDIKIFSEEYVIPYDRFIVIGDGFSDIPSLYFYHKNGAKSIIVYKEGSLEEYEKAMKIAQYGADYVLERFYVPDPRNATWKYINQAIREIAFRKCQHSYQTIHKYRWSRKLSEKEKEEIETHLLECDEHELGLRLTHVIPNTKSWYSKVVPPKAEPHFS